MYNATPLLFALHESQHFAARVAQHLGLSLSAVGEHTYEDGEYKCHPQESVAGRLVVLFAGLYPECGLSVHDKLCRLLFLCSAIKDAGAQHLQVVSPYLCYSRKEQRIHPQDPIITRHLATLMEASRIDSLTTMDVHSKAAFDNAFRIPTQHLENTQLFADYFIREHQGDAPVATSPDLGGIKRTERFRQVIEQRLGYPVAGACVEKYRYDEALSGSRLIGSVEGRSVVLIDDLISTGSTLMRAAEACYNGGAKRVWAMATHALLTTGSESLLESPLFERIVVSDSIPSPRLEPFVRAGHVEVLDTSAVIAAALESQYAVGDTGT